MNNGKHNNYENLGFGIGLRTQHYDYILQHWPAVDWFEIITENYLVAGGQHLHVLDQIASHYPVVMHGVSLSIGSTDTLNFNYLKKIKQLANRVSARWLSDHLCWTGILGLNNHDLLPLPYTRAVVNHVVRRIQAVQDYLGQQILLENVSSYVCFKQSEMDEWEFIKEIAEKADCFLLLDINNIYVSAYNHGFDPKTYIDAIPKVRVKQLHLAGHDNQGDYIIDTHDHNVIAEVWDLYAYALQRLGAVTTLLERDDNIPPFEDLRQELHKAKEITNRALAIQPC